MPIIFLILWVIGALLWIENIAQIVWHVHDPISLLLILRLIGILLAPLGVALGLMDCV